MGVQGGGPREADVGGQGNLRWETTQVQVRRPREAKVGGQGGRPKWEAV